MEQIKRKLESDETFNEGSESRNVKSKIEAVNDIGVDDNMIDSIFDDLRNGGTAQDDNSVEGDYAEDEIHSFITASEFKNTRLNVVTQQSDLPYSNFKLPIETLHKFLDDMSKKKLFERLANKEDTRKYKILTIIIYKIYQAQLTNQEDLNLIVLILNAFLVKQNTFKDSNFRSVFKEIIGKRQDLVDKSKINENLADLLDDDDDDDIDTQSGSASVKLRAAHFEGESLLYDNVLALLDCIELLHNVCPINHIGFTSLKSETKIAKADPNKTNNEKSPKPTLKLTLVKPILAEVMVQPVTDDLKVISFLPHHSEIIQNYVQSVLFFKTRNNERANIRIYPNVSVGEHKRMNVVNMCEDDKPIVKIVKGELEKKKKVFILINEVFIVYHDKNDSLGAVMKCWPSKIPLKTPQNDDISVTLIDFNINNELLKGVLN
ncbi:hypothetical protein PmNV_018 [Penaeus monodon nudivirus]|uniref:Uncharacterized protein n=1 Tax=Penaeus monodon nudivirus TaxID=1529056 RepID=A0A076FIV3_9VIRU|nr:hypothetical protein PmNV_018 [Penaeus monodon nudivirus]AII15806.1 hypothetical protein PmNV_018 [Penaeus monodon nudivirus]